MTFLTCKRDSVPRLFTDLQFLVPSLGSTTWGCYPVTAVPVQSLSRASLIGWPHLCPACGYRLEWGSALIASAEARFLALGKMLRRISITSSDPCTLTELVWPFFGL